MGVVSSDILAGLRTNFQAILNTALGDKAKDLTDVLKVATRIPSDTEKGSYNWFGITPPMSEWKDKRKLRGLRPFTYELTNKDWESTLEVQRNAILDDKLGMIPPRIKSLAGAYYRAVIREVFSQLDDGATLLAYDGGAMFADTRTIGDSGNIDNLLAGDYSASEAEIRTGIAVAIEAMAGFKDDWGEPLNLIPDTIVCSPYMYLPIRQALLPGVAGTVRPESEVIKSVIANPYINLNKYDWYVLCTTEEFKPIVFQDRQAPQFTSLDKATDQDAFMAKIFYYGLDARFVTGYGDPRVAVKMDDNT
jgi:phage major head subunit gpT-like protein